LVTSLLLKNFWFPVINYLRFTAFTTFSAFCHVTHCMSAEISVSVNTIIRNLQK